MSIRLRLTLIYSLLFMAALTGFGLVLHLSLTHFTSDLLHTTLANEMTRLSATLPPPPRERENVTLVPNPKAYQHACNFEGNMLGGSKAPTFPISDEGMKTLQSGQPLYETVQMGDASVLVYSRPLLMNGEMVSVLQVARSTAEQEQAIRVLGLSLLLGGALMALIAVGSSWWLAGKVLRPIDDMTRTALLIKTERSFERRIPYSGAPDEIGRLAAAFNEMLSTLQGTYQQIAHTLQAQRWFVADASHELRTPLTTLRGNLALLLRDPPISPEDRKAVLADIVDENERMIRLVSDLLTLARADGSSALEPEAVPLRPLFGEIERQVTGLHPHCAFSLDCDATLALWGRRDTLKQVVLILLDNAFKFTPEGGRVTLFAQKRGHLINVRVQDTGIGISADDLPRIFQRFFRSEYARSASGYGLGLAIAKTLIENQGGAIRAQSELGAGSTFTITLSSHELARVPESRPTPPSIRRTLEFA
jgi:two-component system, OmpR family, sensor kinase